MKNITLSVDDAVYDQSRVIAAQRQTTVSAMVREYLKSLADQQARQEQARQRMLLMIGQFGGKVGRMPSRQERHERD